jgi:hypothetical protein
MDNMQLSDAEKAKINAEADRVGARGVLMAEVIRDTREGPKVIQRVCAFNTVLSVGKKQTWRMASGLNTNTWDQGRIGSSSAALASANTNVTTAITGTINTVDSKTMSGRTYVVVWSYPSGAGSKSATVKEAVILNQNTSPGGSALCRVLLSPVVTKTTADKIKLTYQVRIT